MKWKTMNTIMGEFFNSIDSMHIYEFEVSEIHRIKDAAHKHSSIMFTTGGYGKPIVVALVSTTAIRASIELLDMGYTPVKLLNPKEHD
jgi:hypothetical protein